jgi:hypothetical protein
MLLGERDQPRRVDGLNVARAARRDGPAGHASPDRAKRVAPSAPLGTRVRHPLERGAELVRRTGHHLVHLDRSGEVSATKVIENTKLATVIIEPAMVDRTRRAPSAPTAEGAMLPGTSQKLVCSRFLR